MTKYFSISAPGMTADQEKALAEKWKNHAWWHGLVGFWILRDTNDEMTAQTVRDQISEIAPGVRKMVIDMGTPETWAGSGMSDSNRDWLKKYFPPEGA